MRLNGTDRIITEDDIVLLHGDYPTLSDALNQQKEDINSLKSNLKWIYKYGGVGSGTGGSGGSGGVTKEFSIFATLNNIQMQGQDIVLEKEGVYPLYVRINNPNGVQFNVKYTYTTVSQSGTVTTIEKSQVIDISKNYELSVNIPLNNNSTLSITANDGNQMKQVYCNYITQPYTFNASLVTDSNVPIGGELFIDNAKSNGVNFKLDYTVSVNAEVQYTYTFGDEIITGTIEDKQGTLLFPVQKSLFVYENAGYYFFDIKLNVIVENQNPITIEKKISLSLIPNNLYILCLPEYGSIYNSQQTEDYFIYNSGYTVFNCRVYQGLNENRSYILNYDLNDGQQSGTKYVTERQLTGISVFGNPGENKLTLSCSYGTQSYSVTYYFYVSQSSVSINWYNEGTTGEFNYFRMSESAGGFSGIKLNSYIEQTQQNPVISFPSINKLDIEGSSHFDTHVALGIQYYNLNDDGAKILTCKNESGGTISETLSLYQNKLQIGTSSCEIYIPKTDNYNQSNQNNYHLLEIFSRYVKTISNIDYYEIVVYIDGRLEKGIGQLLTVPLQISRLDIESCNLFLNLIEVSYINSSNYVRDTDSYQYYLKYKQDVLYKDIVEQAGLFNYFSQFTVQSTGDVTCSESAILNIAKNIDIPTLVMTVQDNDYTVLNKLQYPYGETEGYEMFDTSLQYSKGKSELVPINLPGDLQFKFEIQGSSTRSYKGKNFDLSLWNNDESETADVYLFSPNYKTGDTSTFLPEQRYTLKGDIVDSSHSNNTSVGAFVNDVCEKFGKSIGDTSYYSGYIKNCLEGFKFLLYLNLVHYDASTETTTNDYYYLGIYNFNLGRDSYFNLGYKDLSVFCDEFNNPLLQDAEDGFTFYHITPEQNANKKKLIVAEVSGNNPYFDFSQWDGSILFEQTNDNIQDKTYMLGDLVYGDSNTYKSNIQNFVKQVALSGGYLFNYIKKKFGPYDQAYHGVDSDGNFINQVPDYSTQYYRSFNSNGIQQYTPLSTGNSGTLNDLTYLIESDDATNRLPYINFTSLSEYYTICMAFGLVDSVQKNLNIKSWNGKTFYLAFYDMDTGLGKSNEGTKVSYRCFSDYWKNNVSGTTILVPESIRVCRDFYPQDEIEIGFDTPSSYLFAVAKYARVIKQNDFTANYPQELWARWRSNTINKETGQGCLCNAKYFMDNYFSSINNIPEPLVSYNYRTKYFYMPNDSDTSYNTMNFKKFNGTQYYETLDWLSGRLHILDAYFNLSKVPRLIQTIDEDGNWVNVVYDNTELAEPTYSTEYNLKNNQDIIVLQDIFSQDSSGINCYSSLNFNVRATSNSPTIIQSPNTIYSYLLGPELYNIKFPVNGNQIINFGGSKQWTYLNSIDSFNVNTTSFYINSDKLTELNGTTGTIKGFDITMPSLKTLNMKGPNYSGELILESSSNFPNLQNVDISNSQISLNLVDVPCQSVVLDNVTTSKVNITGCSSLNNLSLNKLKCDSLVISPFNVNRISINGETQISQLNISTTIENAELEIQNDSALTVLTTSGFSRITIGSCPNLKKIEISTPELLTYLNVTGNDSSFTIGSTEKTVDLTSCTNLQQISLYHTGGVNAVKLPNGTNLLNSAFAQCSNLQYLSGTNLVITGSSTFQGCSQFTYKQYNGGPYCSIKVSPKCTDISNTFYNCQKLTLADAQYFLTNAIPVDNSITNISSLFYGCTSIVYNKSNLISDYSKGTSSLNFSKFTKVTSATNVFYNTGLKAYYKGMLNFGNPNGVNITQFTNSDDDDIIYVMLDSLENMIEKITYFGNNHAVSGQNYVFVDSSGNELTEIPLKDFFNPNGKHPIKLITLRGFRTKTSVTMDFTDVFTSDWVSFKSMDRVMWRGTAKGLDNLLYNLPNFVQLFNSFKCTNAGDPVNLMNIFNWDKVIAKAQSESSEKNRYIMSSFDDNLSTPNCSFSKYISYSDYLSLWNKLLNSKLYRLDDIFNNTTLIMGVGSSTDGIISVPDSYPINTTIKTANGLFFKFGIKETLDGVSSYSIQLDRNIFKHIPNATELTYVFAYDSISNYIPYDFFNRRYESTESVYIKNGEEYTLTTKYQYLYKQDITSLTSIFLNCTFNTKYFIPTSIPVNRIDGTDSMTYYKLLSTGDYQEYTLESSTEYTDTLIPTEGLGSAHYQETFVMEDQSIINPPVSEEAKTHTFVAPDIFYGCTNSCSFSNAFNNTNLEGVLPKHLLRYATTSNVNGMLGNVNILPIQVATNVYCYLPSKFTTIKNLDQLCCWRVILPPSGITYYMFGQDSIDKNTTFIFMVQQSTKYYNLKDSHYRICYNIDSNGDLVEGINPKYFTSMQFNTTSRALLYSVQSIFNGHIFTEDTFVNDLNISDTGYVVINLSNSGQTNPGLVLPKAAGKFTSKFIAPRSGDTATIYRTQIVDPDVSVPFYQQSTSGITYA